MSKFYINSPIKVIKTGNKPDITKLKEGEVAIGIVNDNHQGISRIFYRVGDRIFDPIKECFDQSNIATADSIGLVKGGTTIADTKTYGVDIAADGAMTVAVPWEDTEALTKDEIAAAIASAGV